MDVMNMLMSMMRMMPPFLQERFIHDVIGQLCISYSAGQIPENERGEAENWEGRSPRDVLEQLCERLNVDLPDGEDMAQRWREHVEHCGNPAHGHGGHVKPLDSEIPEVPDTLPSEWFDTSD